MNPVELTIFLILAPIYILLTLALWEISFNCPKWLSRILVKRLRLNNGIGKHQKVINLYLMTFTIDYMVSYQQEIKS